MKDIVLATINAKWIHPSLALRLLKANLDFLEDRCEIIEFNLRQPLAEKLAYFHAASLKILGVSVSIWNHTATLELFEELEKIWAAQNKKPVIVLGGPEVSHLPKEANIFRYADYVICGEGEIAFRTLCENILTGTQPCQSQKFIYAEPVNFNEIKSAYHLYTDEDIAKKLIYVEASRGCPFNCEFCLSAVKDEREQSSVVREFPLEPFFAQMDVLVRRGVKTFKFLDRTFNLDVARALRICEFFLEKIEERKEHVQKSSLPQSNIIVHFEMVPSLFPPELRKILTRFPPGTLRLEIGIQTFNSEVAARIGRPSNPEKELETICFLRERTNAIIHAGLIAGLPGEDIESFGVGFDRLWLALSETDKTSAAEHQYPCAEIQLGILKLLPGAPISRHNNAFGMRYNHSPPYEIEETSSMSAVDIGRIKNFARFWELIVNRGLVDWPSKNVNKDVFKKFLTLSDLLYSRFGRNWGIGKDELLEAVKSMAEFSET